MTTTADKRELPVAVTVKFAIAPPCQCDAHERIRRLLRHARAKGLVGHVIDIATFDGPSPARPERQRR